MKQNSKIQYGLFVLLLAWGLLGCGLLSPVVELSNSLLDPEEEQQNEAPGKPKEIQASVVPSAQIDVEVQSSASTQPPASTPVESHTATPDLRMLPEQWRDWPVVPEVTHRAIEIYLDGLAKGNNPHAFSKVGDCHCVNSVFFWYL